MSDDPPLSDEQVYELLHQARLSFSNRTLATELGRNVVVVALRQMDYLQTAMTQMMDEKAAMSEIAIEITPDAKKKPS